MTDLPAPGPTPPRSYVAVILLNHAGADTGHGVAAQAALVDWLFAR